MKREDLSNNINNMIKMEMYDYINKHINHISKTICFHNGLQRRIAAIAKIFGFKSIVEYEILDSKMYNKYIDVVWLDKNENIVYAIEIDSSLKTGSIKKLNYIKAENKIWVLYCNNIYNSNFDDLMNKYNKNNEIKIIYLGALRQYLKHKFKVNYNKTENNLIDNLLENIEKIHTTELGIIRIKKNLGLKTDNVVNWCKKKTKDADKITKNGKNWYVYIGNTVITINAKSYTIITAHKRN